jgi:hypothetical protein
MYLYPDKFIRGISTKEMIDPDGIATPSLFQQFIKVDRDDNYQELSITWFDNLNALHNIMGQKKKNDEQAFQFSVGVAIVLRSDADRITQKHKQLSGIFSYERCPTDQNPYHGNLLLKYEEKSNKSRKRLIAAHLALFSTILYRENFSDNTSDYLNS